MTKMPNKCIQHSDGSTEIFITYKGKVFSCFIDTADYPLVKEYRWFLYNRSHTKYAYNRKRTPNGRVTILMHRLIMNPPHKVELDHADRDGLNNRRINLRLATRAQNAANRVFSKPHSSQYKGVLFKKDHNKFSATLRANNKVIFLGYFDNEQEAAQVYNRAFRKEFGEFARIAA